MKTYTVFVLSLAILGAFSKPQSNNFQSNSFNGVYCSPLPVLNTHIQTAVVENPTVEFPSFIPPTTISQTCHHLNTLVRPRIQNEIITVPTVDSIVRTVPGPIVETVKSEGDSGLALFAQANNMLSAVVAGRNFSEGASKNNSSGGNNGNNGSKVSSGKVVFLTNQNNEATNGINIGLIARPTFFTVQSTPVRNVVAEYTCFSNNAQSSSSQDSVGTHK